MEKEWVSFNPLTNCYETPDGTSIAAELAENQECLADVFKIACMRSEQRKKIEEPRVNPNRRL